MNAAPAAAYRQRHVLRRGSDCAVSCLPSAGMPRLPLCTATETMCTWSPAPWLPQPKSRLPCPTRTAGIVAAGWAACGASSMCQSRPCVRPATLGTSPRGRLSVRAHGSEPYHVHDASTRAAAPSVFLNPPSPGESIKSPILALDGASAARTGLGLRPVGARTV